MYVYYSVRKIRLGFVFFVEMKYQKIMELLLYFNLRENALGNLDIFFFLNQVNAPLLKH